ncbi:hypothetical protein [Staphylococcus hominis]|uniref:Uncharacterized protein n=1 Tax=Staphylococcus hominis TaxID=1290 RepID=A0A8X8KH06_STAHO|nr:hypothetical protein [Staphylococcus hominis]MCM5671460.1 hypothetical protein [Staphylococcus hominis]
MEYSVDEFQYDSLPQKLSESIIEKENILNGIKHRYAKEVGKVFYEAQQEFSDYNNGGLFKKWYSSLGFKQRNVYNYIQIYNEVQQLHGDQLETFEELPKRLQLEVSKPSHIPELKEKVLDGDIKTHKEYKELERQLKQRDEQNAQLQSQVEQAQRSEEIAKKQLEDAESREPEVIEKYMEPEDYQSIKNMNEHLESEREYYKKLADDFRNEVKDMMDQPSNAATFTKENDNEDYTPILLKILEPSELFIQNYKNHISEQEVINKLEKIIKKLKEQ